MSGPGVPPSHGGGSSHAHVNGRCTTWVDEALDAAAEADPDGQWADVPRPGSCCEKDDARAREAARVHRLVAAADPTARAAARYASRTTPSDIPEHVDNDDGDDDDDDDETCSWLTDSDDDALGGRMRKTLDPMLLEIQERRIREMKAAAAAAAARAARATYGSSKETDLPALINDAATPSRVVLHFPMPGADESARIDEVLDSLAPAFPRTRFVRIAGKHLHQSPMLATLSGAPDVPLPALVCFRRRRVHRWTAGLDELGGEEGFDEDRVVRWLASSGEVLPGHPAAPKPPTGDHHGGGVVYSSDDEGPAARGRGDEEEGEEEGVICESMEAPACGRPGCAKRYPHTHVRALRHGDAGRRGSDDDDDSD